MLGKESLRLGHELADETVISFALLNVGVARHYQCETDQAALVLDECLRRYRRLGDARYAAIAATILGWVMLEAGDYERAGLSLRDGVVELKAVGDRGFMVQALNPLAHVSQAQGEARRASTRFATKVCHSPHPSTTASGTVAGCPGAIRLIVRSLANVSRTC